MYPGLAELDLTGGSSGRRRAPPTTVSCPVPNCRTQPAAGWPNPVSVSVSGSEATDLSDGQMELVSVVTDVPGAGIETMVLRERVSDLCDGEAGLVGGRGRTDAN